MHANIAGRAAPVSGHLLLKASASALALMAASAALRRTSRPRC
jgi:hypothetical protein